MNPARRTAAQLADGFRRGRLLRWHSHPRLAGTQDRLDGHAARVARIILALHPDPPAQLLAAALVHDDGELGEVGIGDLPGQVKERLGRVQPEAAAALAEMERDAVALLWEGCSATARAAIVPQDGDARWLRLADRLDRLMWVAWQRPGLLRCFGWRALQGEVALEADKLGVTLDLQALLDRLSEEAICG